MPAERIVFSREQIRARVAELGERISRDYRGRPLLVVGVLTGAFIFTADLVRVLDLEEVMVDFVRVASYGDATVSSGRIALGKDVESEVKGRELLLVEDIVDTGRTLAWLTWHFAERGPASLKVCTLLDKRERREIEVPLDYVGFRVEQGFLVGYGLDCAGRYRQRPDLLALD